MHEINFPKLHSSNITYNVVIGFDQFLHPIYQFLSIDKIVEKPSKPSFISCKNFNKEIIEKLGKKLHQNTKLLYIQWWL